jgi:hypothetical protein
MWMFSDHFTLSSAPWRVNRDNQAGVAPARKDRPRSAHRPFRLARLWKALASDAQIQPSPEKPGL